ncbi:hypothetical protein BLS_003109 [Venturia inaequalis]|uniref:Luciferase-like domain-containing protein n=1 Tax=Venturia inaequalis TaxID=5025 RepID=A0A8H3YYL8_VENIN|nr:hypothetical protein BLS_003109 [Venturia inaequalis]
MQAPCHLNPGLHRHPDNQGHKYNDIKSWIALAQKLEAAKFHAIFFADVLGGYDVYRGPANLDPTIPAGAQFPINDPLYSVAALSAATSSIGFGITASTTYEPPYSLARRCSTVDQLINGRVAWNIVTSFLDSAARNFNLITQIEHDERYNIAHEYLHVVYKLWEGSWRDDAVGSGKNGAYADPKGVRQINHEGKHFKVPGPHLCEPSPQRTPFLFQAGTSTKGKEFAATHAEAIFLNGHTPELVAPSVSSIRKTARELGRNESDIKIVAGVLVIVAETDDLAHAKFQDLVSYGDEEGALALFGGWSGYDLSKYADDEDFRFLDSAPPAVRSMVNHWATANPLGGQVWNKKTIAEYLVLGGNGAKIIGGPKTVADELERWIDVADVDGFNDLGKETQVSLSDEDGNGVVPRDEIKVKWYRGTYYNATILGICNFLAPGIWGAMNSLGAGGEEKPYLVNGANALTFCLMVVSCFFSSVIVKRIGIKWALVFGTMGYAPYAAGLYTNNRFGTEWFVLVGAALCGTSAGVFWMAEAAIALSYPEPYNQGRFLGFWLSFRIGGQVVGGAINLALNAANNKAGKVSYNVYLAFIALQCLAPFAALLLTPPSKVQRKDGVRVDMSITDGNRRELALTTKLFFSKKFLLIVPLIGQAVYTEAVMFTFESLWFSVRARALGSFLSGIVAMIGGNLLGLFLDRNKLALKSRARGSFVVIMTMQGAWWIWATILVTDFRKSKPTYDWVDAGFGKAFALFLFWVAGFQINYLYLYFVIGNLAETQPEVIRIAGLLRGTESAWQAVSYGLNSVGIIASVGGVYLNFALWALAIVPGWLVIKDIGTAIGDVKIERESAGLPTPSGVRKDHDGVGGRDE